MKASDMTLTEVREFASRIIGLSIVLSYIQVEEGLAELQGHWDGFCDTSNYQSIEFDDKRDCAIAFGLGLAELLDLSKYSLHKVGQ
jgi:hypothetical protein